MLQFALLGVKKFACQTRRDLAKGEASDNGEISDSGKAVQGTKAKYARPTSFTYPQPTAQPPQQTAGGIPSPELPSQASPLEAFPQGEQDMHDNCRAFFGGIWLDMRMQEGLASEWL